MSTRRLDQLLSALGYGSRREAQGWCDEGRLTLDDGQVLPRANERVEGARVRLDGQPLDFPDGLLVALHKPVGFVCSHDSRDGRPVYELLPPRWRLRDPKVTTVGRLDLDTSGLVLVTDDGPLVHRLTSPKHHVEKVYLATLDGGPLTPAHVEAFAQGLHLAGEDTPTLPARLVARADGRAEVTLHEGRYHQVRRMFAAVGLHVQALERVRFGPYQLGALAPGAFEVVPRPLP